MERKLATFNIELTKKDSAWTSFELVHKASGKAALVSQPRLEASIPFTINLKLAPTTIIRLDHINSLDFRTDIDLTLKRIRLTCEALGHELTGLLLTDVLIPAQIEPIQVGINCSCNLVSGTKGSVVHPPIQL